MEQLVAVRTPFVLAQSLTVTLIGVALFIVSTVAGQSVTGLVVDRFGIGPGGARPLTPNRVAGAVLMVVAVGIAMSSSLKLSVSPWLLAMPVCGYGFAWVGHFVFEKNRPATFRHPVWSLMGDWVMFWQMLTGKIAF